MFAFWAVISGLRECFLRLSSANLWLGCVLRGQERLGEAWAVEA